MRRLTVVLLVVASVLLVCTGPVAAQNASVFPVSQAEGTWPSQDGENVYYDVAPHPDGDTDETLVVPRGFNEMVVYYSDTFHPFNLDLRPHFRAADWHPSGEYALVASGQVFEAETGVYRYEDRGMSPVFRQRGGDTLDVSFNDEGEALAVAFMTQPSLTATVLYSPDGEEFRNLRTPAETRIRSVDWSPDGERAAIVGQDGTVFVYEDGELRDESAETEAYFRDVEWTEDGAVIVGSGGITTVGLPTDGGVVYEWRAGEGAERVGETEYTLNGVATRPDGSYSLAVGGEDGDGRLYRYDGNVDEVGIGAKGELWGVGWTDNENALLVGDEEIWRYSYSTSPEELPPKAEFTVQPENPTTEDTVTFLGFGSTSGGSADRVERWKFDYGQENPEFSRSRRVGVRFPSSGEYNVSLVVEDEEGERSEPLNRTVVVDEAPDTDGTEATDRGEGDDSGPSPLPGFTFVVALVAAFVAFVLRIHTHQD